MSTKTVRKWFYGVLIAAVLVAGGGAYFFSGESGMKVQEKAVYYCPMHPGYTSDRPGDCPICNMKLVKREEVVEENPHAGHEAAPSRIVPREMNFQDLMKMKPGEICLLHKCKMGNCEMVITEEAARAGKCPHCGEDLGVIVKDALPLGYSSIKLTAEKERVVGVKTAAAVKKALTKTIRTVGRIAYDPELYQAEGEYIQAFQAMKKSQAGTVAEVQEQSARLVESARLNLKLRGLSEELIGELETAGAADRSLLYSDAGGRAWLYAPVYEYEIPLVKTGQKVIVEIPAITGKTFEGTVRAMDSVMDAMTRTVRVRVMLDNPEGILKPEMYVNATLQSDLGEVLTVPEEAVFSTGEKNVVFVAKADGVFEPREVMVGAKTEDDYEIKSGISEGETVVTSGNFLIDSESRLKAALQGLGSGGEHQHGG